MTRTYIGLDNEPTPKEELTSEKNLKKVFAKYPNHDMALIDAAKNKDTKSIKILLHNCPELLGKRDESGKTALMWAAQNGSTEAAELLIQNSKEVGMQDNKGMSALMWAAYTGQPKIVEMFINKNKELTLQDNEGRNALAYAVSYGDVEHFRHIDYKERKQEFKERKKTNNKIKVNVSKAADCAVLLVKYTDQLKPKYVDNNGITPLMRIVSIIDSTIITKLKEELGTEAKNQSAIRDKEGHTAFDYFRENYKWAFKKIYILSAFWLEQYKALFPQLEEFKENEKEEQKAKQSKTNFQDDIGGLTDINDRISAATASFPNKSHSKKFGKQIKGTEGQSLL